MKKLEQMYLRDLRLKGVPGIKKVFLRQAKSTMNEAPPEGAPQEVLDRTNGYRQVEEWLLDTEGINLREVRRGGCGGGLWGAGVEVPGGCWGLVWRCWGWCAGAGAAGGWCGGAWGCCGGGWRLLGAAGGC